jgi:two-component system LytT family response regulator
MLKGYGFIRCHQAHLVNKKFVVNWLKKGGDRLLLSDGNEIPVSKIKMDDIKEMLL